MKKKKAGKKENLRNSKGISGVFWGEKKDIRSVCYTRIHIKAVNEDVPSV